MTLKHFGVKGMRWGVRKTRVVSSDYAESRELAKKKIRELTNADLKKLKERLNLESEVSKLKSSRNIGKTIAGGFLNQYGKMLMTAGATLASAYTIKRIGRIFRS